MIKTVDNCVNKVAVIHNIHSLVKKQWFLKHLIIRFMHSSDLNILFNKSVYYNFIVKLTDTNINNRLI